MSARLPRLLTHVERMDHETLQGDLARFMDGAGMIVVPRFQLPHGGQQIDVFAMTPYKYAQPDIRAYEVKVSRSDFLADVKKAKWTGYLGYVNRVFFAAHAGLLKEGDVPVEAGLIVRGDKGWQVVKAARYQLQPKAWTDAAWMALLSRNFEFKAATRRLSERVTLEENVELAARVKGLGYEISRRLRNGTTHEENSALRLWAELVKLDPKTSSEYEALSVIRGAYALRRHIKAIKEIGQFLASASYGSEHLDRDVQEALAAVEAAS